MLQVGLGRFLNSRFPADERLCPFIFSPLLVLVSFSSGLPKAARESQYSVCNRSCSSIAIEFKALSCFTTPDKFVEMAPKKKKKAASNPARGFATVSVPSKPRSEDTLQGDQAGLESPLDPISAPSPLSLNADDGTTNPDIQDMLPDQLEEYLGDAELQALLDSDSTRWKSEAARQISRLRAEVRQLRGQAMTLSTMGWLDDSTIARILSDWDGRPNNLQTTTDLLRKGDHSILLDLWILQQVLSALAFPRVADALANVVQRALTHMFKNEIGYVWGLTVALDWYGLNLPIRDLPDYQSSSIRATDDSPISEAAEERLGAPHPVHSLKSIRPRDQVLTYHRDLEPTTTGSAESQDPHFEKHRRI